MKELSTEEKAKRYDEAIEELRGLLEGIHEEKCEIMEEDITNIFPELKESEEARKEITELVMQPTWKTEKEFYRRKELCAWLEKQGQVKESQISQHENKTCKENDDSLTSKDERIRKELIDFVKSRLVGFPDCKKFTDWLEKQGDYNRLVEEIKRCKELISKEREKATSVNDKLSLGGRIAMLEELLAFNICNTTDKVEPKFKVGDFIVNDYCMGKVIELTDDAYLLDSGQGIPFSCEHNVHLWTIQDAKDGDVLASELCCTIMLYKGIEDNNIQFYCDYDFSDIDVPGDRFAINNGQHYGSVDDSDDWHPATKEQRDLLLQKMHEAGYEWDYEKKELKKIINKKQIKKNLQDNSFRRIFEQNSARSGEDESIKKELISYLAKKKSRETDGYAIWLKSLKDRVQPQPKQEWSEEDEKMLNQIIKDYERGNESWLKGQGSLPFGNRITWLKSLKPQNRWKPSDEQMIALQEAMNIVGILTITGSKINSLYQDLKKLKIKSYESKRIVRQGY